MRTERRKMIHYINFNVECIIAKTGMGFVSDWVPGIDARCVAKVMFTDAVSPAGLSSYLIISNDSNSHFCIYIGGDSNQKMNFQMFNNKPYPQEYPFVFTLQERTMYEFELNSTFMRYDGVIQNRNRTIAGTLPLSIGMNYKGTNYKSATFHIYSIKCWNNGILERDFVPAKKNRIYGLYDKVNGKFWSSSIGVDFLGKDKQSIIL